MWVQKFTGMGSRIRSLGSGLIILLLLVFAGRAVAQDLNPRCEAAMDRATAGYSKCLLRAQARHARHKKSTKLEQAQARCQIRFDRRTSQAINDYGADECAQAALVTAMGERAEDFAGGVAFEASGAAALELLYIQSAGGGTLTETELRLTEVGEKMDWFSSRPYREAGRMGTQQFLAAFSETGLDSLGADPPNAQLVCEKDGEIESVAVTLMDPVLTGENLAYSVELIHSGGEGTPFEAITCDSDVNLFIDSNVGSPKHATIPAGYTTAELVKNHCFASGFCSVIANIKDGDDPVQNSRWVQYHDATVENTGCSTTSAGRSKWNLGHSGAQRMLKDHSWLVFVVGFSACHGPSGE